MTRRREFIKLIAQSFSGGRWLRGYIQGKLSADPVFDAGLQAVDNYPGMVIDLGCGLGLFGLWLRINGSSAEYRGCDLNEWKIAVACKARDSLGFQDLRLNCHDLESFLLNEAKTICLFDVFHYLPIASQKKLIIRLAEATRHGAQILIRTGVTGCGWRSFATSIQEWWIRESGWISGGRVTLPDLASITRSFEELGCNVESVALSGRTPFSSYFLKVSSQH
jgi:SAM-dependent methyltransferase